MKRDTKGLILEKAYVLFLEKGYDAVSISMIQEEVGIGRATMYHHFPSKQELFFAVLGHYFKSQEASETKEDWKGILLSDYLRERIANGKKVLEHSIVPESVGMLNYFMLTFQALGMNPSLSEHSKDMHQIAFLKWKTIIENSIVAGEVREDVDSEKAAKLFMNIRHGVGVTSTFNTSMRESIDEIDMMYQYIFSLIKSKRV